MRILLLGNTGQLGWELERSLPPLGEVFAIDYPQVDLAHLDEVRTLIRDCRPQVIFNAAAYTAVDRAESEADLAMAINARAPGMLAEEARALGAAIIHYSTDYVFDGMLGKSYSEGDPPNPLNMYGKSKLEGEQAVQQIGGAYLILRTSWVYSLRRDSFVTKVLGWARKQRTLKLVNDQISNPTWCRMLAEASAQLMVNGGEGFVSWLGERSGLYHLAGSGFASRLEWGKMILKFDPRPEEQVVQEILPASSAEFPTPARRPLFTALNCARFRDTFGLHLPDWQDALRLAMEAPPQ
jgi:dTDP-4-dehydrorhamnose reductase